MRSRTMSDMLSIGAEAPDFTLACHTGEEVRLSDHRGRDNVVLVFYPKNNTPG
jgi:peroxiredoxin Q/BCP